MSSILEVRGVSKAFAGKPALIKIDLTLTEGSTTVLLGSSGSGKSTLIRILLGLVSADEGEIQFIGGEIGYVPQDGRLFPHLTGRQNLELVAESRGWERGRTAARMTELEGLVALDARVLDRYPKEMSGGQRQRVALLRALLLDPAVLIFDEPLGALDPLVRNAIQKDLKAIFHRLRKTVLLVTHDLAEARYFGDEIVLMHEGQIVQRGTYKDLIDHPATSFVGEFLRGSELPE